MIVSFPRRSFQPIEPNAELRGKVHVHKTTMPPKPYVMQGIPPAHGNESVPKSSSIHPTPVAGGPNAKIASARAADGAGARLADECRQGAGPTLTVRADAIADTTPPKGASPAWWSNCSGTCSG
jgi:hypothetical protein